LVYTGYRLDELIMDGRKDWLELLREVDVLVDGPFIQSRLTNMPLVGSDNQRVILLSKRVARERIAALNRARVQVSLDLNGLIRLVGTGSAQEDMHGLVERIRAHGVILEE
jgi:anaerobic ribonucleoside-triphosphate reductase activating protein